MKNQKMNLRNMNNTSETITELRELLKENARLFPVHNAAFFKTSPGQYAEHDEFIGVKVPILRKIASARKDMSIAFLNELLHSKINEERLLALFILIKQYNAGNEETKLSLYNFYMENINCVNNWNLVDSSAHLIIGSHLMHRNREILATLATTDNLWLKRISIVSTWFFIRNGDISSTLEIAGLLVGKVGSHKKSDDLIHKAIGWMLREASKKDETRVALWLQPLHHNMPKTILRECRHLIT